MPSGKWYVEDVSLKPRVVGYNRLLCCGLFLIIFTATTALAQSVSDFSFSENIAEALQKGEFLLRRGNTEEALLEFENVVLMDETNIKGLTGVFHCHLKEKRFIDARDTLDTIARYTLDMELYKRLSDDLEQVEKLQDQIAAREFFDRRKPDFESSDTPIEDDLDKRISKLKIEDVYRTDTPQAKFAKAIQLHRKGFTTQAIPLYMEAIMEQPQLAQITAEVDLMSEARLYYERVLVNNPNDVKAMFIQAWLSEHYMNSEQSQALYEKILSLSSSNSMEFMVAQAKLDEYQEQERLKEEDRIRDIMEQMSDKERHRKLQISNGQWAEYQPEDYRSHGLQYLDDKKIDLAIIHFQGAVKITPHNPEAHYLLAMAQLESAFIGNENGYVIAKRELETCLNLDPDAALRQKAVDLLNSLTQEDSSD